MRKKVLIVDDDAKMIEKLRIPLIIKDFEVLSASNGLDGLNMIYKEKPDFVILDLLMPKMDGLKVARLFKFDTRYAHIPVIAITHLSRVSSEKSAKEVGIDEFFSKPIDPDEIIACINKHFKQ